MYKVYLYIDFGCFMYNWNILNFNKDTNVKHPLTSPAGVYNAICQ